MEIKETNLNIFGMVRASFRLTRRCNNNCPHCYVNLPLNTEIKELTVKNWCTIIDQLVENGINYLSFTGGEPTVYPGFKEVYMYAKRKGMLLQLMTNATCFDEETKNMLYKYPPQEISVTVYGVNNETYFLVTGNKDGWKELVKNIEFLTTLHNEKGVVFNLTSVFTKDTIKFSKEINEFGIKYTGKKPDYIKLLYGRIDGNIERNEMIKMKRLDRKQLKRIISDSEKERNFYLDGVSKIKDNLSNKLFLCSIRRRESLYFFEDGTVSYCIIMPEGGNILKLNEEELENFDYKKMKEKLRLITEPLLDLKINEICASCTLRTFCLTCPIRNLLMGLEMDGYNKESCLRNL